MYLIAGLQLVGSMFSSDDMTDGFVSLLSSLLTAAFAVSLMFFAGFHIHLVLTGQSTIEASLKRRAERTLDSSADLESQLPADSINQHHDLTSFSAGSRRANWDAVFGSNPWLWFLPIDTLQETGYEFDFLLRDDEEAPLSSDSVELLSSTSPSDHPHSLHSPRARALELEASQSNSATHSIALAIAAQKRQHQPLLNRTEEEDQQAVNETPMTAIVRELNQE